MSAPDADFTLSIVRRGRVARLTFARGPANHVSVALLKAMADALEPLEADKDVGAVVLAAQGKAFCAGADLTSDGRESAGQDWLGRLYEQGARLAAFSKPLIAAVGGPAVGAGLGLALVCDYRVVSPEARFWGNFVKLGSHPGFAISRNLPAVVGVQRATLMLLAGRRVDGRTALDWGLADRLTSRATLTRSAASLAAALAETDAFADPVHRAAVLAGFRTQAEHERGQQNRLRQTADYAEGVRAVAERRPGRFVAA